MIGKNNPFNIRYVRDNHWLGQTEPVRGFCSFSDLSFGLRAAFILICRTYRKNGVLSVSDVINKFAPSTENDTNSYVSYVCSFLGVFPWDIPSSLEEYVNLLCAMSEFEGNFVFPYQIYSAVEKFNLKVYKLKK